VTEAKARASAERFHVPVDRRGDKDLEVTNCDLQILGRPPVSSPCVHGARCGNALERVALGKSGARERRNHARLRATRQALAQNTELARKLEKLEKLEKEYDAKFRIVFDAIRELMDPPLNKRRRIGFRQDRDEKG
jgi:hypothetical protein